MARNSQVGRAKGLEARVARPISLEGHNLLHESGVRYCCSCGAPLLAYAQQAPADAPLLSTVSPPEGICLLRDRRQRRSPTRARRNRLWLAEARPQQRLNLGRLRRGRRTRGCPPRGRAPLALVDAGGATGRLPCHGSRRSSRRVLKCPSRSVAISGIKSVVLTELESRTKTAY